MTGTEFTAIAIAALALIGTLTGYMVQNKRNDQDALTSATESWKNLIEPLENRIKHLEEELEAQNKEIGIQRDERSKLADRVETLETFIRLNTEFDPEKIA